ncbi:alcohol dehydrogenase [Suillus placidus]|uniref:Alcohol dehydrogenase n=1 Tax=Suillus placidus TaxID=48579 RepID=A0A9P7D595_9AGAM|nr:alcohol dehydrogenase [Suillus placidus]
MHGWIKDGRSYLHPVKIGEVMRSGGLGVVVLILMICAGWTEYAVADDKSMEKISPPLGSMSMDFLNTLGMPVVSGAAGAFGALVCQLGKWAGAHAVGIADKALNYKSPTFCEDFMKAVGYLDMYFDNIGGEILDLALSRLNQNARVVLCGGISTYNDPQSKGLTGYLKLISQHAKMQGFIIFDYAEQYPVAVKEIAAGLADGLIKSRFHIVENLQNAPSALPMLSLKRMYESYSSFETVFYILHLDTLPSVVTQIYICFWVIQKCENYDLVGSINEPS